MLFAHGINAGFHKIDHSPGVVVHLYQNQLSYPKHTIDIMLSTDQKTGALHALFAFPSWQRVQLHVYLQVGCDNVYLLAC